MTTQGLTYAAMRLAGILKNAGDVPSPCEYKEGLLALNSLLDRWANEGLMVYRIARTLVNLTVGKGAYQLGVGAPDWPLAAWPPRIQRASVITQSTTPQPLELPMNVLTSIDEWQGVPLKNTGSTFPLWAYYDRKYPYGIFNVWPVPQEADQIALYLWEPLGQFTVDDGGDAATSGKFFRTVLLGDLTTGNDIADIESVYLDRTLVAIDAWLSQPITQNLQVRFSFWSAGVQNVIGTFTLPAGLPTKTVQRFTTFSYTNAPDKTAIQCDILASDGSITTNTRGIAGWTLVFSGSAEAAPGCGCDDAGDDLDLNLPPGYQRAIEYGLAVELATRFPHEAAMRPEVLQEARDAKAVIKSINLQPAIGIPDSGVRSQMNGRYDWRSDAFRM